MFFKKKNKSAVLAKRPKPPAQEIVTPRVLTAAGRLRQMAKLTKKFK
jgi:hypothetical protein